MRLKITFPVAQAEMIGPMFKESTVESNTTEAEQITQILVIDPENYRLVNQALEESNLNDQVTVEIVD